jgi:hypothetical protein
MMNLNWKDVKSYGVFEYEWFMCHIQDFTLWELISLENLNEDVIIKIANYIAQLHINGKKIYEILIMKKDKDYIIDH